MKLYMNRVRAHVVEESAFSKTSEACKDINVFCKNVENCAYSLYQL